MKKIPTLTMLGFALALGTGLAAQETPAPPMPQRPAAHDWTQGPMAERLKLTDAQKAGIKEITARHKDALTAKGRAAKAARKAFFEAAQKPETSAEALRPLFRQQVGCVEQTLAGLLPILHATRVEAATGRSLQPLRPFLDPHVDPRVVRPASNGLFSGYLGSLVFLQVWLCGMSFHGCLSRAHGQGCQSLRSRKSLFSMPPPAKKKIPCQKLFCTRHSLVW